MKNYNLPRNVENEIKGFAEKYGVEIVKLFGSRARGDNGERSDVDLAVYGGDFDGFYFDLKENINSLLSFDLVEINEKIFDSLMSEIAKDGVTIYEKA